MSGRGEKMRMEVLGLLRREQKPLSAYALIAALKPDHPKIAPPTVYRALTALVEGGQVHRIESLNAFVACRCEGRGHASIMSICDDCGLVEENDAPDVLTALSGVAGRSGFQPTRHVVELHGRCASCGDGSDAA